MQRVAVDLYDALGERDDVELNGYLLRSTWKAIHRKTVPFLLSGLIHLPGLVRDRGSDVVLFSSMVTASLAVPLRDRLTRYGARLVAIVHGLDVTTHIGVYQRFVPKIFGALDLVLPVSDATGEACLDRGLRRERMRVVPNGIRLDRFPPLASRSDMRTELLEMLRDRSRSVPDSGLLLCSVGRQVTRKGISWFVDRVMPRLPEDVHYWIAGEAGPDTQEIRVAIARHGLEGRVRLLGKVPEDQLILLYRGSDLFVMPNVPVVGDMEGFGVVMLEAGACGLPVVASRLEGIVDVVAEGRNGHFAAAGDPEGFARAIMAYYRKPEGLSLASRRARIYTAEKFGWDVTAGRYVEVLRERVVGL
jgi:phosphatidylinositol alpha-1,6-mannosyltransferase